MLDKLRELMVQYIEVAPEDITPDKRLIEDLGFNSYDLMSLLGELEQEYDVTVEESEVMGIQSVQDIIDYIEKLRK